MRLGFLTACFPDRALGDIVAWAAAQDFTALEVAAWPHWADRPYAATHLDVEALDEEQAAQISGLFRASGLRMSSVVYYENNLDADLEYRARVNAHVRRCIDAAALLGCSTVGTFVGRDVTRSVRENLRVAEQVFAPLIDHAAQRGVTLIIENCPMQSWHPDGYPANLAYSPELWDWLIDLGLKLNFDPSHLLPLGIDPLAVLGDYVAHVAHVQAKDIQVFADQRNRYGVHGKTYTRERPGDAGWWRYRVPGLGDVDWRRLVDLLYVGGYDGTISVEHEDPVWSGTPQRVEAGLLVAQRTLAPLIVT